MLLKRIECRIIEKLYYGFSKAFRNSKVLESLQQFLNLKVEVKSNSFCPTDAPQK